MTWNELMDRMQRAGLEPYEEEFMDDYGVLATRKYTALEGRYFRCMFAATRVEGFSFETYVFPSAADAIEFKELMTAGAQWRRRDNLVLHGAPEHLDRIDNVIQNEIDGL